MVGRIAVAAGHAFVVLNSGVVRFDFACGGAGNDQYLEIVPPPANGSVDPVRFRSCRHLDQFLEFCFRGRRVVQGSGAQQYSQLFLDVPDGTQCSGRIIGGKYASSNRWAAF